MLRFVELSVFLWYIDKKGNCWFDVRVIWEWFVCLWLCKRSVDSWEVMMCRKVVLDFVCFVGRFVCGYCEVWRRDR